jgi:hypothetical protein
MGSVNEWCTGTGILFETEMRKKAFSAGGHINNECATEDELLCEYIMCRISVDLSFSSLRADKKDDRMMSLAIS